MKIGIMPCRSAPRGLKMFFGCLLLCLLTCMPAASQAESITPFVADLNDYAELSFALPSEVTVEPESIFEANYTDGRYVRASLLLNESEVLLYLIYPCEAPETWLNAVGLKSLVDGFAPGLNQTVYSPSPLNISDIPALWGQLNNQILVAYQPSIQTFSLTLINENVSETVIEYLLGSLQITVNESSSPLWPGYCSGDEVTEAVPTQAVSETAQAGQVEQAAQMASESNKEKVDEELASIKEQFDTKFGLEFAF